MSQSRDRIQAGPARIFLNVTVPASSTPPSWLLHTNGVPLTGDEVGFTENEIKFTYKLSKKEINPEQSFMPVDVYTDSEMAELSFTAMETTYLTLLRAFDNIGTVNDSQREGFYFGNGTSIVSPFQLSAVFTAPQRRNPGKYSVGMLYSAYSMDGVELPFTKTKPMTYKVTMRGLANPERTAGDQGGQFYIEK